MKNVSISNKRILVQGYTNINFLAQGSFVTCFTATNSENIQVVITVSNDVQELQTRLNMSQKLAGLEGVQQFSHLKQLVVSDEDLEQFNKLYSQEFEKDNLFALVGPYYEQNLISFVKQLKMKQKLELFNKILKIVNSIHSKNVYHMDLKPSNIMIQNNQPILIDFGQAVTDQEVQVVLNTSAYAPKHDVYSCMILSEKFDSYCLGNILHELYIGQPLASPLANIDKLKQIIGEQAASCIFGLTFYQQEFRYSPTSCLNHPLFNENTSLEEFNNANRIIVSRFPSNLLSRNQSSISRNYSYTNVYQGVSKGKMKALCDLGGIEALSEIQSCTLSVETSVADAFI
ncbi:Kinase [Hexamita inflata]|uniref:CAMK CAMKL n=1 Tax=Hexamita inflata TaxID=28002 RepID=A0AA86PND7_9EUKA|nr:CAMK CAMKL [Hexamita inflata]